MKNNNNNKSTRIDTLCVGENQQNKNGQSHVLPINASSAFSYDTIEESIDIFTGKKDGFVYTRYANPTIESVERKLAEMEASNTGMEAYCILTGSGMSAISTLLMSLLNPGDGIVCPYNLYGGTSELIRKIMAGKGVEVSYLALDNLDELETSIKRNPKIKLVYFESPSNPCLDCLDIQAICKKSKELGLETVIDNTFSTAYLQQPLGLGTDYVVYSTTKFLNGHGNALSGAIICKGKEKRKIIWDHMKLLGTSASPFDAWLLHNGIKTLAVRLDRHCDNALFLAQFLEAHPEVNHVNYPGLPSSVHHSTASRQMRMYGAVLSFELKGGLERAKRFMNACRLCTIASTLGNVDTLLLHPATSSHLNIDRKIRESQGITDGLIRVSVGIENIEDILEDVSTAIADSAQD